MFVFKQVFRDTKNKIRVLFLINKIFLKKKLEKKNYYY